MNTAVLGVDYPCYGEFKCYRCNKAWASLKCWRDFGQKCKSCNDIVKPNEESLLQLYYYLCKTCDKVWKNKRVDMGQPCKTCNVLIKPIAHNEYIRSRIGQPSFFNNSAEHNSNGGHREDLCEKCQRYGAPCSLTYASASIRNSTRYASSSLSAKSSRQSGQSRSVVSTNNSERQTGTNKNSTRVGLSSLGATKIIGSYPDPSCAIL